MENDSAFLHWLAGFIDGEGCFLIREQIYGIQYLVEFALRIRDDDIDIILEIQKRTGIGWITLEKARGTSKPVAGWRVSSQGETRRLVDILDNHPLRARKKKDYQIWREAVLEQQKSPTLRDLAKLKFLHDKIRLIRIYDSAGDDGDYKPFGIQLELPISKKR